MAVVLDVITDALRELGVLAAGEVATADDANGGLLALNRLVDQWAAEELWIYQTTRTTWSIVSGTASYTLGAGGNINIARPVFIDHINFQNTGSSPTIEYQMSPLTDDAYSRIPIKTITAPFPTSYYYNPTFPTGTVTLWPVPTSSTLQGVLYAPQAVAEFAGLTTTITLPPGYRRMLIKNLAVELAPSYERQIMGKLDEQARESKSIVKRANKRLADMSLESAALIQGRNRRFLYNILVGP